MKLGQVVRLEGVQAHVSKMGTPTMGGLIFLTSWIFVIFLFEIVSECHIKHCKSRVLPSCRHLVLQLLGHLMIL